MLQRKYSFQKGNFYKNGLTDLELRKLYQKSIAVIIPLKDVYQPSGYSVALQAMMWQNSNYHKKQRFLGSRYF